MSVCEDDIEANIIDEDIIPVTPPPLTSSISAPVGTRDERKLPAYRLRALSDPLITGKSTGNTLSSDRYNVVVDWLSSIPIISPALIQRISSTVNSATFNCTICMEYHPYSESFSMSSCELNHTFCKGSMTMFLTSQINDGILTFKCPHYGECNGTMNDDEIRSLLEEEVFQKYLRFKGMKVDVHYRECPVCEESVRGDPESPAITCSRCGTQYCYYHANAHPTMTCEAYTRKNLRTEMKSRALISSLTIKCPGCGVDTEKNGGCNHIKCHNCQQVACNSYWYL